jgi:hypothetical protein
MKIISYRQEVETTYFRHQFNNRSKTGPDFAFPCDKDGNLLLNEMFPPGIQNYQKCLDHPECYIDIGIEEYHARYTQPAIGLCCCGQEVELEGFINTCECGIDYNWAGQRLSPREQWGWDTGESYEDIVRGGDPFEDY